MLPLAPYRVLELSGELGWLCGKILADLGADVVTVEPPEGDPGRGGHGFLAHNTGKRSVVLDLETGAGQAQLLSLAARADFLIETFDPGHLDRLGLGWEGLRAANPRLVLTSITPYGQTSPNAAAPASDLEIMAAGGAISLAGDPDRAPVRVTLPQAGAWTGAYAAMGTLIAHHHRQATGRGQHVDVSAQAAILPILVQAPMFWSLLGEVPVRSGPNLVGRNLAGAKLRNIWPCRDGYVSFALYSGAAGRQSNRALAAWMAARGMLPQALEGFDWDAFDPVTAPREDVERIQAAVGPFLASLAKNEFLAGCEERRLLGYPVATAADIAEDVQLADREAWQEVAGLRHPSGWARFGARVARIARPAPGLGEHQAEVLAELGTVVA